LPHVKTRLVVLTGGPGAGKTAVLEIIRKQLCQHAVILPEAASIIYGGGFWRMQSLTAVRAAQRAIMHVQHEMERLVLDEGLWALGLCDRGLLDGMAYWPGDESDFWREANMTVQDAYSRYHAVIHLRVPTENLGYNHINPLRIETARQAQAIDARIAAIWSRHPNYHVIDSQQDFLEKAKAASALVMESVPACCKI
jgi:hypothetical protein